MPSLVSPGVAVTVIDESFYVPGASPTVPLFFIATEADKPTPDGLGTAAGTQEYGVIRTITSAAQLAELYGVPTFKETAGSVHQGHFLNEYGLQAIFNFLAAGSYCYVVRANIDLATVAETPTGYSTVLAAINAEIVSTTSGIRTEWYEYNLALAPGFGYSTWHGTTTEFPTGADASVATNLIALSNDLDNEAFVLFDGPAELSASDFATEAANFPKSAYAAVWYNGGVGTNIDGTSVWIPATSAMIRIIALNDSNANVWDAPAGFARGVVDSMSYVAQLTSVNINTGEGTLKEVILGVSGRDVLYADGSNVNPIDRLPGRGLVVMGQKTQSSTTSALDRINVVRMLASVRRAIRKASMSFLFQPNDQITLDNLRTAIEGYLGDIMSRGGLYDFAVVADSTNNTAARRDRNELWVDIALKPMKSVEFIYVPIRVLSTGASL